MPESPNFEQIAERILSDPAHAQAPSARVTFIATQLRQVWNARGAADRSAISSKAYELLGSASGAVYAGHFDTALKALDRP